MPGRTSQQDGFHLLVQALSDKLGPSRGIDSDDIDPSDLQKLMEDYVSNESEWEKYALASEHVPYTRNLVDKGNGKSNLVRFLPSTSAKSTDFWCSSSWSGDQTKKALFMSKLSIAAMLPTRWASRAPQLAFQSR
ncbi:hypothetical protein J1614_005503 [Plenodomus biglobosus]|nr:hypothetical protein J1614_005503 [Plenodomus biglobosus]